MKPNVHIVFPLQGFADFAQVMQPPRGELFNFGLNPYNGNIVMSFQDNPEARFAIRLAIQQLAECADIFDSEALNGLDSGMRDDFYSPSLVSYDNLQEVC